MAGQSLISRISGLHNSIAALFNYLQSPLLLAIRLYWGWQFAQTGWGKLHRLSQVAEFFTSLGLPHPHFTALFIALVEFIGGILFACGLGTRVVSLALFINMSTAYWIADKEALGKIISAPEKFYAADPYTYWFAALIVLIFGPGAFALDWILGRYFGPRETVLPRARVLA
jgi:putative oxidoreductase